MCKGQSAERTGSSGSAPSALRFALCASTPNAAGRERSGSMIEPGTFPGRGRVAVLKTRPETVLEDYARLMDLAGFREALPRDHDTVLKINISWDTWYPACSTAPWQLEAVVKALRAAGYEHL